LTAMKELDPGPVAGFLGHERLYLGLIANKNNLQISIRRDSLHRPRHNGSGRMIAAHGIERDPHGLLLLFQSHDLAPLVVTAIGANLMRQHGLLTIAAILNLNGLYVQMTPPLPLPGMRRPSLRNRHDFSPY
jgi:hypothetical protein